MRPSQRTALLDAALRLLRGPEGADITLDAVAREAGITKPGLMYHFPTREALLLAIVDHAAGCLERAMTEALDGPLADATPAQRVRAYAEVAARGSDSRAEYAVWTEAAYRPSLSGPWLARLERWLDLPDGLDPRTRAALTVARLAADGLWAAEATGVFPPRPEDRDAVVALIRSLTDESGTR
jgi:AcrR family transcriptional regulator